MVEGEFIITDCTDFSRMGELPLSIRLIREIRG
jgi:hypothetical protein